jgi:hypothetical protein
LVGEEFLDSIVTVRRAKLINNALNYFSRFINAAKKGENDVYGVWEDVTVLQLN